MNCEDRNQDLLLLAHGELGGLRRTLVEHHLRRCSRCQARRRRYGALSSVVAGEVRPRDMPPWTPHAASPDSTPRSAQRLVLCVVLAILLGVAATAAVAWTPPIWWNVAAWNRQSQTIDTSCQTNVPGNVPAAPANGPAALPPANHPAPAVNAPSSSAACPTLTPSVPRK